MRNLGWWIGWLLMSLAACGRATRNEREGGSNVAGRGNHAGESGVTGGVDGVSAGTGGTTGVAGGTTGDECADAPKSLDEYCSRFECPETPDDVDLGTCEVVNESYGVSQRESSCGGVSVISNYGFGAVSYYFDADGQLEGISWASDVLSDCPGSLGSLGSLGRQCTPQGPATNLCDLARCDAVGLQYWCSEPDACSDFASLAAIQQLCTGGDKVERFASSCGGAVFHRQSDTESSEWSFDDNGKLLGVVVTNAEAKTCLGGVAYSKVHVYGEPCEAVGEGVDQCRLEN